MTLVERPYRGAADFEAIQALISRCWLELGSAACTVGDVEWWGINDPDEDPRDLVSLWFDGPDLVGWAWLEPPGGVAWLATPGTTAEVLSRTLDRLEAAGTATSSWAMDADVTALALLADRGYIADGRALHHWIRRLPAGGGLPLPEPDVAPGYRRAATRWPEDLDARVDVHRSAFDPSRMTVEKYRGLATRRHYSPERDRVIVAPDGSSAAFANAWWDPVARIGELEPVGVHADHRRRGLGRAVCFDALRALADLGAEQCLIFSIVDNAASEALYASLGATVATTSRRYARSMAG